MRRVLKSIGLGLLTAMPITLTSMASCVSYAQLIQPTTLSVGYLAAASFFSAGISSGLANMLSYCPFLVTSPDMTFTLFFASGQMAVFHALEHESYEVREATAFVALHVGALILGVFFILLGRLRIAAALSYLPYPVIAGFLAMIGAAVVKGALKIVTPGLNPACERISLIMAICFACTVLGLRQLGVASNMSSPPLIVASLIGFYVWHAGSPLQDLADHGWLLQPSKHSYSPLDIFQVDLGNVALSKTLPGFDAMALILVASINRALTVSAIESTVSDEPYSVDAEMSRAGAATVVTGTFGGIAMNPTAAMTSLCKEGAKGDPLTGRCTVVAVSSLHLLLWATGFQLTNYLPRFLLGGLLMQMGGGILVDWAIKVTHRLQLSGTVVIYAMIAVSIYHDMTSGIALGIVLALGFVSISFAKLEVLKYHVSGIHFRSGEEYTDSQRAVLRKYGDQTHIVGLTGFVFEGVAISLAKYLKEVVRKSDHIETLVVDCEACQGINDSACSHLFKVAQMCEHNEVNLVFCHMNPFDEELLRSWKLESTFCRILPSLTQALEVAERKTLEESYEPREEPDTQSSEGDSEKLALGKWLGEDAVEELMRFSTLETVEAGYELSKQNERETSFFIAVPGHSDVQVEVQTGTRKQPAVLLRSTLGAICAPEALIGSHNRGTWKTHATSVVVRVQSVARLKGTQKAYRSLMSAGLHQQLLQSDQLSALYTMSKGGGWRGVTFDASTSSMSGSAVAAAVGPGLRRRPTKEIGAAAAPPADTSNLKKQKTYMGVVDSDLSVAAVLDVHRFVSPRTTRMLTKASSDFFDEEPTGINDTEINFAMNRYSVSRLTQDEMTPHRNIDDLFAQEEEEEDEQEEQAVGQSGERASI
eukprot:TRINITY_DN14703_c0_g2_i1.p1 TRINITY_DN14703_c0_g2~~TRINITY_DN14703_c0_g2_i1.p1  ORF type:complete len:876 (+),score=98.39 TRINITY_DN14703_c0_g2_i1:74-2701(+)